MVISLAPVRNLQITLGIFSRENLMTGICSTSERRVEYSKCTNAVTQRIATVGSFNHPQGWRDPAGGRA